VICAARLPFLLTAEGNGALLVVCNRPRSITLPSFNAHVLEAAGVGDVMGAGGLQQTARHPASLALLGLMPGAISAVRHELFRPSALRSLVKHDIALAHTPAVSYRKCTIFQHFRTLVQPPWRLHDRAIRRPMLESANRHQKGRKWPLQCEGTTRLGKPHISLQIPRATHCSKFFVQLVLQLMLLSGNWTLVRNFSMQGAQSTISRGKR